MLSSNNKVSTTKHQQHTISNKANEMNVKFIRKVGLWIIVGVTLLVLLLLNVLNRQNWTDIVVIVALVALVVWFLITAIWYRVSR